MAVGVGLIERERGRLRRPGDRGYQPAGRQRRAALRACRLSPPPILRSRYRDQAYALIIQPGYPGIPAGQFTQVNVVAKEFSGTAWTWLSTRQWSEPAYLPLGAADPREVGGYRIVARLGAGQAGTVYLASGRRRLPPTPIPAGPRLRFSTSG